MLQEVPTLARRRGFDGVAAQRPLMQDPQELASDPSRQEVIGLGLILLEKRRQHFGGGSICCGQ